jgi:hypothetical protein
MPVGNLARLPTLPLAEPGFWRGDQTHEPGVPPPHRGHLAEALRLKGSPWSAGEVVQPYTAQAPASLSLWALPDHPLLDRFPDVPRLSQLLPSDGSR